MSTDEPDGHEDGAPTQLDDAGLPEAVTAPIAPPLPEPPRTPRVRSRPFNALIVFTTILLVVGIFATWANRLLFNPDNWSNTSTHLLQNPNVRATTANYIVNQIYANVDVPHLIQSGLPTQFKALAAPISGALRE